MMVERMSFFDRYATRCGGVLALVGLLVAIRQDYLLFHCLAEIFFVVVAFSIFVLAWNSRHVLDNNYLLFLGISYLFVGGMHVVHALAYKGMGVFPGIDPYLATQIWVGVQFLLAVTFLIAPLFLGRNLPIGVVFLDWVAATVLLLGAVFDGIFPVCFVEGQGLTPFKKVSELVISAVFLTSLLPLYTKRSSFDPRVFRLIVGSVILSIGSEIAFTIYRNVFDFLNVLGHLLMILSAYFMYAAIIVTGLQRPRDLLFRQLNQTEQTLRKERTFLSAVLDTAGALVTVLDRDGRIVSFNRACEDASGYAFDEVKGRCLWEFMLPSEEVGPVKDIFGQLRAGQFPNQHDNRWVARDGTRRLIHWTNNCLADPSGQVEYVIATGIDITERKRAELLLRQANTELARKNAEIEQFLYTASHDLKSPLVTIQGFLGHLSEGASAGRSDRIADYTERIRAAASRMARLINDLLVFSRAGRLSKEPTEIALVELVSDVARNHLEELAAKKISIEIQDDMPTIRGDRSSIRQVFDHLLSNAINYGSDAAKPRIEIGASQRKEEICVFVRDNGKGIPAEYQMKIFELFHRLEHDKEGVGSGLAIVKRILEGHGGRVWVDSRPGEGATFWLAFPTTEALHADWADVDILLR